MNLQKSKNMIFPICKNYYINDNVNEIINKSGSTIISNTSININKIINNKIFIICVNTINLPHDSSCDGIEIVLYNNTENDVIINSDNIIIKSHESIKLIYSNLIKKWI